MRRRRGAWSDRDGMDKRRGHVTDADPSTSPVLIAQRVAAVADAGYTGLGLIADDVAVIRDNVGFDGLRNLLTDHGLTHRDRAHRTLVDSARRAGTHLRRPRPVARRRRRTLVRVHQDRFTKRACG